MEEWIYESNNDNSHRFLLGTQGENPLVCIGVNPSTATKDNLDNTMKKVSKISILLGYDSYIMINLYSQRATDPNEMDIKTDEENNRINFEYINQILNKGNLTIWAAWGTAINKRKYLYENLKVIYMMANENKCKWINIGEITKEGHPRHPLYLPLHSVANEFDIEKYISLHESKDVQTFKTYILNDKIYFLCEGVNMLGSTNYTEELWNEIEERVWHPTKDNSGKYKYIQAADKSLHQLVVDYYFGEEERMKFYEKDYIIEHLDNNGFNCEISNLYFLLKIKNTYKGWYFDKKVNESLPIMAMAIYHIISNHTFQISIRFNTIFIGQGTDRILQSVFFLYEENYEIVLQDAENMMERITKDLQFSIEDFNARYRYKKISFEYSPDILFTEEEKKLPSGSLIVKDNVTYVVDRGDFDKFHIVKNASLNNWNLD